VFNHKFFRNLVGGVRMSEWNDKLKIYDELIAKCPRFERKGKTMIYTSANGYMFSALNKAGEIGIRFSKATQQEYIKNIAQLFLSLIIQ
jgi:hypothetical protein